jgi:holo-[acyl-carrier protein] synthase
MSGQFYLEAASPACSGVECAAPSGSRNDLICGVGVDLVETSRMSGAFSRHGERLVRRVCLPAESVLVLEDARPVYKLSAIFAIKEAVMKALGTGMRGVGWKEIRTDAGCEGPVDRLLSGRALSVAHRKGAQRYALSVTVSDGLAIATVLLE